MPQMFPLLWLCLFSSTAMALFVTISSIHFSNKKSHLQMKHNPGLNEHNWKW